MEASTAPKPVPAPAPTPAPTPTPVEAEAAANGNPSAEQAAPASKDRIYGVFTTEISLDVGSAAGRKAAGELLAELAPKDGDNAGKVTVLVRRARIAAQQPKEALKNLGQLIELDGDYEVIADSARNVYKNVKTKREVTVSIG